MGRSERIRENPELRLWVAVNSLRLVQDAEQVQADDHDQRNACQPKNYVTCHDALLDV